MKIQRNHRLKGNALVITVVVSIIILLFVSGLLMLGYIARKQRSTYNVETRLKNNLQSLRNLALSDTSLTTTASAFDLFGEGHDSVHIATSFWGLYQVGSTRTYTGRFAKKEAFLLGAPLPVYMDGCLYMADHQRPLALVGKTKLLGDAYLSKAGIRAAYIDQRGFEYPKLLEGTLKTSQPSLPSLKKEGLAYLQQLLDSGNQIEESRGLPDSLWQSFIDSAAVFQFPDSVTLRYTSLSGHIVVKSLKGIHVEATAQLRDVLLVAPIVKIDSGFQGSVQVIASEGIAVGPDCAFYYPSSLVLVKQGHHETQPKLVFGQGSAIRGTIMALCDAKDPFKTVVQVDGAVYGIVYANGYLSLKSTVTGTVLADYFIYKTSSSIYENYLLDVSINKKRLSSYFAGSPYFDSIGKKTIVQWLE